MISMVVFGSLGLFFKSIKPVLIAPTQRTIEMLKTQFVVQEKPKPIQKIKPVEAVKPKEITPENLEPIDLTKNPVLNQKLDDVTQVTVSGPVVKRVYGLRRVYSTGIGAGGNLSDAVVGKLGNTLNAPIDTVVATKSELKGQLASITTVTAAPRLKNEVKPEYTPDMIDNKIEGTIRAKLLIDVDGSVKAVAIENDLGYGSGDRARAAFFKLRFDPAMRGTEPVAVWIQFTIRFVLLQG